LGLIASLGFSEGSARYSDGICCGGSGGFRRMSLPISGLGVVERDNYQGNTTTRCNDFNQRFPPWRLIGTTCAGFLLGWWGWHSLRNNRRLIWGYWVFTVGLTLWGYSINFIMQWWLGL
jgi:hypothetical protein